MNYGQPGSFLGMTFNDLHSSQLGITRTSSSNRYIKELMPAIKEFVVDKPNSDGQYWFGAKYTKRTFNVSYAFDGMSEDQRKQMEEKWCDRKIHDLIFDEEPYKVWSAKITAKSLKAVPFDDPDDRTGERIIYKGEGTFTFTCYFPFARSRYEYWKKYSPVTVPEWRALEDMNKDASEYGVTTYLVESAGRIRTEEDLGWKNLEISEVDDTLGTANARMNQIIEGVYENLEEWKAASGLPETSERKNCGDLPMPFSVTFGPYETGFTGGLSGTLSTKGASLEFNISTANEDSNNLKNKYIRVNMYKGVIEGLDEKYNPTGSIYNNCITNGDFFLVPVGGTFSASGGDLEYHYWYL